MNIAINRSFQKDVRRVKDSESLAQLQDLIGQVRHAPDIHRLRQIKKIKGGDTVTFVRFLHRRDIYRRFP